MILVLPPSFTCKRSSILGYSLHRTYRNAGSALDTLLRIDFRLAVDHRNSLNRTRSNTGLTSDTYILINNRLSHYKTSLKKIYQLSISVLVLRIIHIPTLHLKDHHVTYYLI